MIAFLMALIAPLANIGAEIAKARTAAVNAQTDKERIAAEERVKTLEARRAVMVAEGGTPINAFVRACYGIPPAVYFAKIFIWDKVMGLGTTDNITDNQWSLVMAIIGFYFLYDIAARFKR